MAFADGADGLLLDNLVTRWITRWRKLLLCLPVLFLLLGFNGKWRVGLDSSLYRGLALNFAHGKGYQFGDWASQQVYPGYPTILAGIEKVLGPSELTYDGAHKDRLVNISPATTASVILNMVCAGIVLILTYALLKRLYAPWVATTVTCGVGCNRVFLEQAHSLMTDMPFLAAIMLTLWGWEALRRTKDSRQIAKWAIITCVGMIAAALLRPMIWVFLIAWLIVCVIGLIRGPRRFYAGCLTALIIITLATMAMRPSGYEHEARDVVWPQLKAQGLAGFYSCLHDQLPYAMFGELLRPVSVIGSLLLLGSTLLLVRRHLLWTLLVFGTLAVTILLSDEPRYWMMILPILMLGWLTLTCRVAGYFKPLTAQIILLISIAIVGLNNFAACIAFMVEQHRADFIDHYKKGDYLPTLAMAQLIHDRVRPDQKVLGPSGAILSIFSGVHVYTMREVQPRGQNLHTPEAFSNVHFDYVVFPASLYRQKEPLVQRLIDRHIILMRHPIAELTVNKTRMILATARFAIPPGDWRFLPRGWRPPPPTSKPTTRRVKRPTTRRKRAVRSTTRAATTKRVTTTLTATQPTTAVGPTSRPSK